MLATRGLRYDYRNGPALAFPDLDAPQGATVLLRGRSGAGKSTWLALAAGLLTPTMGSIVVGGVDLAQLSASARDGWRGRRVGFLPQKLHLSDALTVHGNLALAFYAAGVRRNEQAIHEALESLGIADLAQRRPAQLSVGQAQRAALARAILMSPQVILADEPTASLDDDAARSAVRLLEHCADRCKATLVIATHDSRVQDALPMAIRYRVAGENDAHSTLQ